MEIRDVYIVSDAKCSAMITKEEYDEILSYGYELNVTHRTIVSYHTLCMKDSFLFQHIINVDVLNIYDPYSEEEDELPF